MKRSKGRWASFPRGLSAAQRRGAARYRDDAQQKTPRSMPAPAWLIVDLSLPTPHLRPPAAEQTWLLLQLGINRASHRPR
jgi:hypothetical protein